HAENVKFLNDFADNGLYTGTLVIASGATFTGEVFNFHASDGLSDAIDFAGLQYTSGQMQVSASFSQATDITTVTLTNNALHQSASVKLDGSYMASQFSLSQEPGSCSRIHRWIPAWRLQAKTASTSPSRRMPTLRRRAAPSPRTPRSATSTRSPTAITPPHFGS